MKIAILTSGILPIPAVQGGAVENLTDFYLDYNNQHLLYDITIYSVWHQNVNRHPALNSVVNHYKYIKVSGLYAKLKMKFFKYTHDEEYYHYSIEYYLHEAIKDIKKKQYDIIIMENRPGYALKLKDITDAKLVYHLHNEKLDTKVSRYKEIYDQAWRILTVSNFIKSKVQTINPGDTKTITIYNGIDLKAFSLDYQKKRESLGLSYHDFLLVYSGRINRDKGIMELIKAIGLLNEKFPIKLMVIGGSFFGNATHDDEFMKELKAKAESLQSRIIFTGYIPYSDMPSYLSMADIAVIPSIWDDPFPTTVLEAQAIGLPIITTRRGGIPEEVTEENAILLDIDEHIVEKLASSILFLYEHPEKRELMSKASLEQAKLFSKDRYAKDFFAIIQESIQID